MPDDSTGANQGDKTPVPDYAAPKKSATTGCLPGAVLFAVLVAILSFFAATIFFSGFNGPGEPWRGWTFLAGIAVLISGGIALVRFAGVRTATAIMLVAVATLWLMLGLCAA